MPTPTLHPPALQVDADTTTTIVIHPGTTGAGPRLDITVGTATVTVAGAALHLAQIVNLVTGDALNGVMRAAFGG